MDYQRPSLGGGSSSVKSRAFSSRRALVLCLLEVLVAGLHRAPGDGCFVVGAGHLRSPLDGVSGGASLWR